MSPGNEKTQNILERLRRDLAAEASINDDQLCKALTELKVIARNPAQARGVYSKSGIELLAQCAFGKESQHRPLSALESARIIANALLLQDQLQQIFVDFGYGTAVVDAYSRKSFDHEFVAARILFLLTYKSKLDFVLLIEKHDLGVRIREHLEGHAVAMSSSNQVSGMQDMALLETLKLLYNIASKCPAQMHFLSESLDVVVEILSSIPSSPKPLDPPISQLLNVLAAIDWGFRPWTKDEKVVRDMAEKLVQILDQCTSSMNKEELEAQLIPLLTVLRKTNALELPNVKTLLRESLLPQDAERNKPLGQSTTLASRLLKLQTAGGLTLLPDTISSMLFDLSDRDATTFVRNIGYGHAAGYLMTHKIAVPEGLGVQTAVSGSSQINPVTGQRLDAELPVEMSPMTEEEKEREAERLYVLFERLRATGVVKAENPVRTAHESGRFEELSDSDSE